MYFIDRNFIFFSCKKETSCEGCRDSNKPPIALAGPDQVITLPTDSISLDGRSSSDPDGTISEWLWTKIAGPASFAIRNSSVGITIVKNLTVGIYHFELKVTDNGGLFSKDTVQIIVNDPAINQSVIANAGPDQTITLPLDSTYLDGSGSFPNGRTTSGAATFEWTEISGPTQILFSSVTLLLPGYNPTTAILFPELFIQITSN